MSDLDELMTRNPLELTSQDIDAIIDYHRKLRIRKASGEKISKPKPAGVDISSITKKLVSEAKPDVQIVRRKL